ncbi:hypothetical protein CISIN_1g0366591mg, partial [Citrus sinensis]
KRSGVSSRRFGAPKTAPLPPTIRIQVVLEKVIDTRWVRHAIARLFDFSAGSKFVGKEIVTCIGMAKDGIHAVLVVFSVRSRFSQEEEAALHSWQTLFGKNVFDYMIVVFTGGDELEDNDETLEDYLGRECPKPLKSSRLKVPYSILLHFLNDFLLPWGIGRRG